MNDPDAVCGVLALALSAAGLALVRLWRRAETPWLRLVAIAAIAALGALWLGGARVAAIDRGAFRGPIGQQATATGIVAAVPKRSRGEVRIELRTGRGKLLVTAREPVPDLQIGAELRAAGVLANPDPFLAPLLRRRGIAQTLRADRVEPTGAARGGPLSLLDRVRARSEQALDHGMPAAESALARGFVLGQDDRIDAATVDDFKRSGLAHHLAVSGENVVLLALLAMPFLALAGLHLRGRLLGVLGLIAIYVPVAGAGASIQRAGVMGAAGIVAALAGRPRSRLYALLLAAFATLALNPRAVGDIGWQLSFAAVIGIFLWSRRLATLLGGAARSGWRQALAQGAAMTAAATLSTAPLMAHHFDRVSLAALPANLLALPAVAPAMWLGMLAAAAGQIPAPAPAVLVVPLNALNGLLLAYIEQVAHWFATPSWAVASLRLSSLAAVVAAYAAILPGVSLLLAAGESRRGLRPAAPRQLRRPALAAAALAAALILLPPALGGGAGAAEGPGGLRISILDVGQGDAILLRPPDGAPVLVDGGPPGDGLAGILAEHGVSSLGAAIVTHDQSDHAAGILDLLGRMPVAKIGFAEAGPQLLAAATSSGTRPQRLAAGSRVRSGGLRLDVLWPPRELLTERPQEAARLDSAGIDPNRLSLVLLASWRHFSILLTGDAEAVDAAIEPGPIDVLKVAHHGSADPGLDSLLERAAPRLAVISVGENSYGHPAPETLATLGEHAIPTLRTDVQGTIEIEAGASSWRASGAG